MALKNAANTASRKVLYSLSTFYGRLNSHPKQARPALAQLFQQKIFPIA
ncbi:hypothetical protein [Chitinophaga arvensicola]|nr:hypothetical protein [Chitinophaga arvensicola]